MGKSLIQQARGKGGPNYRAKSFAYSGEAKLRQDTPGLVKGKITDIIKCPGHTAPLMQVKYEDGETAMIAAPEFVKIGDIVQSGPGSEVSEGNTLKLKEIPEGTPIYNIESQPGDGGKYCRTSGSAARVLAKTEHYATIQLPSKKEKIFPLECRACIGIISGGGRGEKPMLKAGVKHYRKRMTNKRWPNPSAAAQNAVAHTETREQAEKQRTNQ
jgi:large subunit ribosomal protein L2